MTYTEDRGWSDSYIPALRNVVGPLLLDEATIERDTRQATDLIVFTARDMHIGCRVRRPGYADKYPWDFTIRRRRDTGTKTEFQKITEGWCDWLVYAHANDGPEPTLARWFVIDLDVFRFLLIHDNDFRTWTRKNEVPNGDGTHHTPYDIRRWPAELIVAASHKIPRPSMVAA